MAEYLAFLVDRVRMAVVRVLGIFRPRLGGEMRIVRLEDGDMVVLEIEKALTEERISEIKAILAAHFAGHKVMVLHAGMKLSILRPVADDPHSNP